MPLHCERCRRTLPSSDEPPSFCAFCGHRLNLFPETPLPHGVDMGSTIGHISAPDIPPEETTPATIGGYKLLRLLGTGGMGRVFEGESISTGQRVAVKLLSARLASNAVSLERFRQEGRLASQITHPKCVFVLGADTDNDRPYIVMELMQGETLRDLQQRRGLMPPQEALSLILDVIEGLQEAHRLGVIHRDVKPSNCFLMPDGHIKIGDFGLSKSLGADGQLTQSGAFLGTVLYASPEQIRGESVDFASDVYSVCATLYELLAGKPPFEHENVTAALARIISEDAPPLRSVNPKVPRSLARVVEKGLERDRSRRWADLNELHDALVALMPTRLSYGSLTIRFGAYLLDEVFVRLLLVLPVTGIFRATYGEWRFTPFLPLIVFPVYFVFLEGLFGASIGKRLLRLRVCSTGSTDPPGLKRSAVRTLAFYFLVTLTLMPLRIAGQGGRELPVLLSILPLIAGLVVLIVPMRRSNNFRGMHEALSGTCVLKLPPKRRAIKLHSKRPNPLRSLPPRPIGIPEVIGPYTIKGSVASMEGEWILLGEDAVLSREILLRLLPQGDVDHLENRHSLIRPTRARFIHHGRVTIDNTDYVWEAYVAPSGAPITELARSDRPFSWPETRYFLEQLAEELRAAQSDATLPRKLSLDQIWLRPDGRVQLLDFAIPRPAKNLAPATHEPMELLRAVAVISLEGEVRPPAREREPIRAAIPLYARTLLHRLIGGENTFANMDAFAKALADTRDLPPEVDPPLRLGQLTVQAASLAIGLLIMFGISGTFAVFNILEHDKNIEAAEFLREKLRTETGRAELEADPMLKPHIVDNSNLQDQLQCYATLQHTEVERMDSAIGSVERRLVAELKTTRGELNSQILAATIRDAAQPDEEILHRDPFASWREACLLILIFPAVWTAIAFLLRGGFSYWFLGIAVMRSDGRKASHRQCALRCLMIWLPIALLLCGAVWIQAKMPSLVVVHGVLWLAAFALLPIYFALALTDPDRGIHDRLLGTRLVPR